MVNVRHKYLFGPVTVFEALLANSNIDGEVGPSVETVKESKLVSCSNPGFEAPVPPEGSFKELCRRSRVFAFMLLLQPAQFFSYSNLLPPTICLFCCNWLFSNISFFLFSFIMIE